MSNQRYNNKQLTMTYKKEMLKLQKKIDDNIVDIIFGTAVSDLEILANDFLTELFYHESVLLNSKSENEDLVKALDFYERVVNNEILYAENKDNFLKDKGICPEIAEGLHSKLRMKIYEIVTSVCDLFSKDYRNLNRRYIKLLGVDFIKLNARIFSKIAADKVTTCGNIVLDETIVPCMQAFRESVSLISSLSESEIESNKIDSLCDKSITPDLVRNETHSRYLNSIAKDNDFILVRQKGSHAQFKHTDGRLVTIPQGRIVGKGLSLRIQKDLQNI